jgi:predicted Zn-dependent protease
MATRGMVRAVPVVIALLVVLYRFLTAESFVNAETGAKHRVGLSRAQESALGLQGYREVLGSAAVVSRGPEVELVQRIVRRLAPATRSDGFAWEASVVRDDQANAFCLPGGKMVVYTGIIPIAEDEGGWRRCWATRWRTPPAGTARGGSSSSRTCRR